MSIRKWKQHTIKCIPLLQKSSIWFCSTKLQVMISDLFQTCKNATLLLAAVKLKLTKLGKTELATALLKDPIELLNSSVCTVKDFQCISGQRAWCPGRNLTHDIGKAILNVQVISYYKCETIDKHLKKVPTQWIWLILKNFSSGHFFLLWPMGSLN